MNDQLLEEILRLHGKDVLAPTEAEMDLAAEEAINEVASAEKNSKMLEYNYPEFLNEFGDFDWNASYHELELNEESLKVSDFCL